MSLCQLLGAPETPESPLQRRRVGGSGPASSLSSPRPLPRGWGPGLELGQAGGWRGLRGAQGALPGPWSGAEGPRCAGTTTPALGGPRLSPQGPAPQHQPPSRAAGPQPAVSLPPGPKSSSPAAQPRAPIIVFTAPRDKIPTRRGADRTPIIAPHTGPQATIQPSPQLRCRWTPSFPSLIQRPRPKSSLFKALLLDPIKTLHTATPL